ncbi:MAG: hypothetical protein H0X38_04325 [Planctomycetes bacterium]|nr:hypothetical protein [Planctomycetota bacterium]
MPDLVVVVDTSGSMGESIQRCTAALARLARTGCGPDALLRVIAHTTKVDSDRTVRASGLLERGVPIVSGGGTDYSDAAGRLAHDQVARAIWITDGDGFLDDLPAGCEISWAITRLEACPREGSTVGSRCRRGELPAIDIDRIRGNPTNE